MTSDEVMALSDEELRVKTAGALGWRMSFCNEIGCVGIPPGQEEAAAIPDYPHDIAAVWDLEEAVPDKKAYGQALLDVISGDELSIQPYHSAIEIMIASNIDGEELPFCLAHANPRSRTRAFILAMTQKD